MKHLSGKICFLGLSILIALSGCSSETQATQKEAKMENSQLIYTLPAPKTEGNVSVEKALANRRSQRQFQNKALSAEQLSQILWSAYGITNPINNPALRGGLRTAPSAGALYPLEIYVAVGNVAGIEAGLYKYISQENKIIRTIDRDVRRELSAAALNQGMIREAPVTVIYTALFGRLTERYGDRSERYAFMEAGHSAQNIYLQAEALGLGTCAVGAFQDDRVSGLLRLPKEERPLYLMPVGYFTAITND
ncbi:MAG: SagB/ThcOx family dehydrogenase [Endomicrobia bacterium]|nr:SagB/ThcOx family dehydrogenase [Endomicrobiia bacterium]MCL2506383.1 SagB/ThcOx family dehydrogenase [Endomicrobiia bacterium]